MKTLFIALTALLLIAGCKKEESLNGMAVEPASDTFSSLTGTQWMRSPDYFVVQFHWKDTFLGYDGVGHTYLSAYELNDYVIKYALVATINTNSHIRTNEDTLIWKTAKVKIIDKTLYFWHDYHNTLFKGSTTETIGTKTN